MELKSIPRKAVVTFALPMSVEATMQLGDERKSIHSFRFARVGLWLTRTAKMAHFAIGGSPVRVELRQPQSRQITDLPCPHHALSPAGLFNTRTDLEFHPIVWLVGEEYGFSA